MTSISCTPNPFERYVHQQQQSDRHHESEKCRRVTVPDEIGNDELTDDRRANYRNDGNRRRHNSCLPFDELSHGLTLGSCHCADELAALWKNVAFSRLKDASFMIG
jgi:hypothetical protein